MIAVYKKFFLMVGVTIFLCLSVSVVWSKTIITECSKLGDNSKWVFKHSENLKKGNILIRDFKKGIWGKYCEKNLVINQDSFSCDNGMVMILVDYVSMELTKTVTLLPIGKEPQIYKDTYYCDKLKNS